MAGIVRYTLDPLGPNASPGVVRAVPGDPMTEILTESFCERCGTRYTFESARPRLRLNGVKVLSRGLKNFVLSDGTSMDEAMASARSETDRELTSYQLHAFHKTFNFCMTCRQYTCPDCWNEVESRCLTCAPHLGHEILPAPFPDLSTTGPLVADAAGAIAANGSNGAAHDDGTIVLDGEIGVEIDASGPEDGVEIARRLETLTAAAVVAEAPVEAGTEAEGGVEAPVEAGEHDTAAQLAELAAAAIAVEAVAPETPTPHPSIADKTAAQTAGLLRRFRPGQNLDAELDAYEREHNAALAAAIVAAPTPDDAAAMEPGIAAMTPEPEVTAEEVAPVAADVVPQPTWRMVAPDPGVDAPAAAPQDPQTAVPAAATGTDPRAEPQWPTRPEWLGTAPSTGLPFLGRPAAPQGGLDALWAESDREVISPLSASRTAGGVQPCVSCGLSLSATARFCRRCGTPQAG
jgi:hypothetical protein